MSSRPWMPFYVADYLRDTTHLHATEHGAYVLLILRYWSTGSLPDDDRQLARIASVTPAEWRRIRPTVQAFFHDGWRHKRIEDEIAKASVKHERRSEAGKRGGIASANAKQNPSNAGSNAQASSSHSQSERKEEDTADAVPTTGGYSFESGIILLKQKDFDQWKQAFTHLDLAAELLSLSEWAQQQGPKWFFAVSAALAKRNREIAARAEQNKADGLTNDERYWGKNRIPGIL